MKMSEVICRYFRKPLDIFDSFDHYTNYDGLLVFYFGINYILGEMNEVIR